MATRTLAILILLGLSPALVAGQGKCIKEGCSNFMFFTNVGGQTEKECKELVGNGQIWKTGIWRPNLPAGFRCQVSTTPCQPTVGPNPNEDEHIIVPTGTPGVTARTSCDPHIDMFSGATGHPMGEGEFILVKYGEFAVHACHVALPGKADHSRNQGFAIKSPYGLIKILPNVESKIPKEVRVQKNGDILFPTGEIVRAAPSHLSITIPEANATQVRGLFGAYNPNSLLEDAFTNSSGQVVPLPDKGSGWGADYALHFQESYRVSAEEALFSEKECKRGFYGSTPALKHRPLFHEGHTQIEASDHWSQCPPGIQREAEARCPQGPLYAHCLHDVAATCDLAEWVRHSNEAHHHMIALPFEG